MHVSVVSLFISKILGGVFTHTSSVVSLFISKVWGGVFTCMSVWYLCSSLRFGVESSHVYII